MTALGAVPSTPPPSSSAPASPSPSPSPSAPASPSPSATTPTPSAPASSAAANTVRVSTAKELQAALSAAVPGRTIQLADGTYSGNFKITTAGTAAARITLTGSPNAVLTTSTGGGYGLSLANAPYWTVQGITVTNAQKGIMVDSSDYVVLDGVTVHHTTMEGVHFRNSSSHGVLRNSTVHDTGTAHDGKGEGVYVGTANTLTDKSDYVQIVGNTIGPNIGAENIDLKEGTTGGLVSGNRFDGNGLTNINYDDSWVDVKGNGYVIENNTGVRTMNDGYQTHTQQPGWGCGTVFRGNRSDLTGANGANAAKYAIDVTNYSADCPVTVTADNTVTGGTALVNPGIPVG
ncbi:right-handed parallel beta-helix repeat-containing protein [Kitasatospora cineracea]|uniref:right-handed parallel beta-helix repeat-containing protein n=1 Tax=Kitasatospora cineracea TaxID=88074 RepID=UPI0036DDF306